MCLVHRQPFFRKRGRSLVVDLNRVMEKRDAEGRSITRNVAISLENHQMHATIPARLTGDDDLIILSDANPGWKIEREADGSITMSPPAGALSSTREFALGMLVAAWNGNPPKGKVFSPSAGFTMPDTAVLSPDASWIAMDRWNALTEEQRDSFTAIVPDVCMELRSKTDSVAALRRKLRRYRSYGATYVVLVDPYERTVWTDGMPPPEFPTDFTPVFDA
jgi:Uma2 family endonuclease